MVWQGCFGKWLAPFSLFYAEKNTKRGEKYRKGQKKAEKDGKNAEKAQGKRNRMPILGVWIGRPKGARGASAASKGKRGFEVPKCGELGNKKRGLERDSEGISGIGGFGAFAIVKGAAVGRGAWGAGQQSQSKSKREKQAAAGTGITARAGARRHAEAA